MQDTIGRAVFGLVASDMVANGARFAFTAAMILLVPTIFQGAAFPAAARLAVGTEHIGRDIGAVVALNMAGGIAGTFLTGFLLVPALGLVRTLGILAAAAAVLGGIAVIRGKTPGSLHCFCDGHGGRRGTRRHVRPHRHSPGIRSGPSIGPDITLIPARPTAGSR